MPEAMGAVSRYELVGTISSAGFSSGHRFVIGRWDESPIGPMVDVMWARPDGTLVLLVDRPEAATFVTAVYPFDLVDVRSISCRLDAVSLEVVAGELHLGMQLGRRWPIPLPRLRRRRLFRPVEALLARILFGVRTAGVSPTGVREWYRADSYRRVVAARAWLSGRSLGSLVRFRPPARFGFSEPPRRAAVVHVRPLLEDPTGRLSEVLRGARSG
jgi:hypothetical protein